VHSHRLFYSSLVTCSRTCWCAQSIPGRTENSVKNHWNATLRRRLLPDSRLPGDTTCLRNYMKTLDLDDPAASRRSAGGGVKWSIGGGRASPNKRLRPCPAAEATSSASEADSDYEALHMVGRQASHRPCRQQQPPPRLFQPSPVRQLASLPPPLQQAAADAELQAGGFRQPVLDDAAAALWQTHALSPIFPGLVLPVTGGTPTYDQMLCGLDTAVMSRAHSTPLPHTGLQAACSSRPGRLYHIDSAGLVSSALSFTIVAA